MSAQSPYDPTLPDALEDEVLAILDGDEAARDGALKRLLAANPAHARTIRAWLTSAGVAVPPGEGHAADPDALPRDLGQYRLLELLGRGGFGTVYRALQQEPFQRQVAVKVINPGMDSREVLARFHAEREALNRMDHPGIARLLDAGSTEQGRPFFVMELVEGPPLATLCRSRGFDLRRRLELFLMVLDAMEHAHQKAVIHRDLSSNNVLVTESDGRLQPKIIDFGIAKSLADPLLLGGAMTFQGTLMGTPEFMSPEQAAGRTGDVDTRADVYALGVQLYELATDQLPIPGVTLRAQGIPGIAKVIQSYQPAPPSAVAPKDYQAALRGDLDAITMRALQKQREERYASVADLAADLRRHLAHEPVEATEPSTWYRLRKFVRRHRVESIAVTLVLAGLLVATAVSVWALLVAHTALDESERQKQEIARRADAGFRLLANEERLIGAKAAARALPPPWPEHRAVYFGWIQRHGEPLAAERPKLQAKLAELDALRQRSPGAGFADMADQHLYSALLRLDRALAEFVAGPLSGAQQKLALLDEVVAPALERDAELWRTTIDEIRDTYGGLTLRPLPGLHPLGKNRTTGLFEFRDLQSGDEETGIVFVLVPADTFRIGALRGEPGLPQNDPDAKADELHGTLVVLDDFLIARTELTRAQWCALSGAPAPAPGEAALPITGVDWYEARDVLAGYDLDLPTEAQWEYACRATTRTPWATGPDAAAVSALGNFDGALQPVGQRAGNRWGLFDMHGNVAEWCRDVKLDYRACPTRTGDGLREGPAAAEAPRVVRGGAWHQRPEAGRSAARDARPPRERDSTTGVRPIRRLP